MKITEENLPRFVAEDSLDVGLLFLLLLQITAFLISSQVRKKLTLTSHLTRLINYYNVIFLLAASLSRFILFVVMPEWLANELRQSIAGGVFCMLICILLLVLEIHANGGCSSCLCNLQCCAYWLSMALLFFFTILYLCLGSW